jgi:hypothetical protein
MKNPTWESKTRLSVYGHGRASALRRIILNYIRKMKDALAALSYFLPNSVCSFRVTIRNSDLQELAKDTVLNPNIQTIGTFT